MWEWRKEHFLHFILISVLFYLPCDSIFFHFHSSIDIVECSTINTNNCFSVSASSSSSSSYSSSSAFSLLIFLFQYIYVCVDWRSNWTSWLRYSCYIFSLLQLNQFLLDASWRYGICTHTHLYRDRSYIYIYIYWLWFSWWNWTKQTNERATKSKTKRNEIHEQGSE